ncbi:cytochrome c [Vibrio sp. S4M6]|uniref:c-type cytochrome n=1 Tax=Vibrio sinus TaxID=2946865 RepID=UPI00202A57FA|nr:cytochrome c [Vibrio sinus]MCL9782156.1 cytochrome c [Vibrio sinus]
MKNCINTLLLMMLAVSTSAFANGDIAAGHKKSLVCAACHGSDGISAIPGYPNLKGQNEQYLVNALTAYKNNQRGGGLSSVMQTQASLLSESDIKNLAAYYASLK